MADFNSNPPGKPHVYGTLGRLNSSFARVARDLDNFRRMHLFEPRTINRLHRAIRELQADANYHLMERLSEYEEKDWARYGRQVK